MQNGVLSTPALLAAMEANFAEEMASLARGLPGGELYEDAELQMFYTGKAGFNGVTRTRFASDDPVYIHARIAATLDYFRRRNISLGWLIGPLARPANLATYLEAHGLIYHSTDIAMALNIRSLHAMPSSAAELTISEVAGIEDLRAWYTVNVEGFGYTEQTAHVYYDAYARLGSGASRPWHHYVGWLGNRPVAIASLLLHAGVAGIYGIATIPEARRRGIGSAMTLYALRAARAYGYRVAILSPTEMGKNIYQRIGFQEVCKLQFYRWLP
jgi:ribosomal protein S18 acetylase RimI-like enzyme